MPIPASSTRPAHTRAHASRSPGLVAVDGRQFPLKAVAIEGRAEGGLAESRLRQTYENPYDEPLEVLYTMPLPVDGAVVEYTITLGERVITGEIERVDEAREAYEKALREGRTAGLLEQVRADTFIQKLGCLPAGVAAEVEIRILHPLAFRPHDGDEDASWEYRFPTVIGVRYEGAEGRVPDAAKLDVDRAAGDGTPVRVELALTLADGGRHALRPRSSSHEIVIETVEDGCTVRLDEAARLDRDLVIRWKAATSEVGVRLTEGPGLPGDDGRYGLLTITPPERTQSTWARDLTVLIDASGSMMGAPLESCQEVVLALLGSLAPEDRFEIMAFADSVETLVGGPVKATAAQVRTARQRVRKLQAGGCTEMTTAMIKALEPLRPDAQRQVILLTDGEIGFEAEVIGEVMRRLQDGCRVHTVAVGSAPNRTLTQGVARAGRGAEIFVAEPQAAGESARELLRATVGPVVTDLAITGSGCLRTATDRLRDVLAGQPMVTALELKPKDGIVEVRGRLAGSDEQWVARAMVACARGRDVSPLPVGALFGRESVDEQELQLAASSNRSASARIEEAIEALGLRHMITTRRTSLVAVADEPTVDPAEPRRRRRLEVELPAGVSAEGVGLQPAGIAMYDVCVREFRTASAGAHDEVFMEALAAPPMGPESRFLPMDRREPKRRTTTMAEARIVHLDDDLLVVEFEVGHDGFWLPHAKTEVRLVPNGGGDRQHPRVDAAHSTRSGEHRVGLTLRLGLRPDPGGAGWLKDFHLWWLSDDGIRYVLLVTPRDRHQP